MAQIINEPCLLCLLFTVLWTQSLKEAVNITWKGKLKIGRTQSVLSFCLGPKAKDLGITGVVVVLVRFFVWFMPYQLPPPCYPKFFKFFKLSLYLSISIYLSIYISINPFSSIFICQSINSPSPFPKYQYIIAADPGAGIGLVSTSPYIQDKCRG